MKKRAVETAPSRDLEILEMINALSEKCINGVFMALEELENANPSIQPNLQYRCGLLDDRHEIYAIKIPDCSKHCLIVSLHSINPCTDPVTVHGIIQHTKFRCDKARTIATRHLKLVAPIWEPAT